MKVLDFNVEIENLQEISVKKFGHWIELYVDGMTINFNSIQEIRDFLEKVENELRKL